MSSCSYAASAMAKTLFARGADFLAAMPFMFGSTNLVIDHQRPAARQHQSHRIYLRSDRCADRFDTDPNRYATAGLTAEHPTCGTPSGNAHNDSHKNSQAA